MIDVSVPPNLRKTARGGQHGNHPRNQYGWVEVDLEIQEVRDRWIEEARLLWQNVDDRYIEQHAGWMRFLDDERESKNSVFELRDDNGLYAYAVVETSLMTQLLEVKGIPLCKRSVKRLRIVRGVVPGNEFGSENAAYALVDLIVLLHRKFPNLPISFDALRPEPDYRIACNDGRIRSRFLLLKRRSDQYHRVVQLPKAPNAYLDQLNPKDRQNIRRHARRLQEHCGGDVQLVSYTDEEDVQKFLDAALPIAKTTYQYWAYNAGLAAQQASLRRYREMARRGWWRGSLLYCKGEPVAFLIGCEIDGTYFGEEVGYNPAWAPWSVGTILMVRRLESLIVQPVPPGRYDFGPGDYEYKRRLVNCSWAECCYDLVPRRVRIMLPFVAIHAARGAANALRTVVRKFGVLSRKEYFLHRAQSIGPRKQGSHDADRRE